jgi:predicted transglutaminase-like cysteine proteinase
MVWGMWRAICERLEHCGHSVATAARTKIFRAALIGVPLLIAGAASQAQTVSLPFGPKSPDKNVAAKPVAAWVKFCDEFVAECAVDTSEPELIALTPQAWGTLVSVNRSVNRRVKPITDRDHWGLVDRWEFPDDGEGDCEDFQLLKRKLLAEAGLPRRAMRITVVVDEKGEGHAVLMIRTDRGDFVLDNKTTAVLPWHQTGYVYVKREGSDGLGWVSLGGATSPTVTANR